MRIDNRIAFITDWRLDSALQDLAPGAEHEVSISPQMPVVLRGIFVPTLRLARLCVGSLEVPFNTISDLPPRIYLPRIDDELLAARLLDTGTREISPLTLPAGMRVAVTLRNESAVSAKPRVALIILAKVP